VPATGRARLGTTNRDPVKLFHSSQDDETKPGSKRSHFPKKISGNRRLIWTPPIKQRGSIMWGFINLLYHLCCRSSLVGMRRHHLAR
jgi:hypothetical protein